MLLRALLLLLPTLLLRSLPSGGHESFAAVSVVCCDVQYLSFYGASFKDRGRGGTQITCSRLKHELRSCHSAGLFIEGARHNQIPSSIQIPMSSLSFVGG